MKKSAAALFLFALIVSACGGTAVGTTEPVAETGQVDTPIEQPSQAAESAPAEGATKRVQPGESVTVTNNGEDWARITVDDVAVKKGYGEYDKPQTKGNVFVEAKVSYEALADGVDYNQFDWAVFADGTAVDNFAILVDGPTPTLSSGTLPKGRKASGYVVYEVPAEGEVLLSYQGNMFSDQPPIFEVVLRDK